MADINSVQLPDGSQYNVVDSTSDYATKGYVQDQIGTITKTTIGLGNVDNTSDANKPVSTAQQNALNEKLYSDVIADEESEFTASRRYEAGEQFIYQGALYKTTTIVPNGDDFEVGTNVELSDDILTQMSDADTELNDNISAIVNVLGAKNELAYPYKDSTFTYAGVSITDNGDGIINLNGTSTAVFTFEYESPIVLKDGNYKLTICPPNGSVSTFYGKLFYTNSNNEVVEYYDYGDGCDVTIEESVEGHDKTKVNIRLQILTGAVFNNVTIRPMLRDARIIDDTYVPYTPTNKELMSYKANGRVGAKNLLDDNDHYPLSGMVQNDHTFTNSVTDILNYLGFRVDAYNDTTFIQTLHAQIIQETGHYEFTITLPNNANALVIKHNGSQADLAVLFMHLNIKGTCKLSLDINGVDPTTVGGVSFGDIMLRIAEDTDPTYQPYAMTNRELTENILANFLNTYVDISSYTHLNPFVAPRDGYVRYYVDASKIGGVEAKGSNNYGSGYIWDMREAVSARIPGTVFIKKGMLVYPSGDVADIVFFNLDKE